MANADIQTTEIVDSTKKIKETSVKMPTVATVAEMTSKNENETDPVVNGIGEHPEEHTDDTHTDGDDSTGSDGATAGSEDEEKGTQEANKEKEEAKEKDADVLLIHDTGFNIKINAPGVEPFDLPVSSMEMVQEIYQVLIDHTDTCHRTCFSLQLDGVTLDNFAELKTIEGLKEGSVVKVVEEPYTVREARIHVRHVRDLLKSIDQTDSYNGLDCNSLAFLNAVTAGDILEKKRGPRPETLDCTPPDYIMPGSKERPFLPLHPADKDMKSPQCLKVLTYSGWNPPPGNRRMRGDLLYLYIVTLEDKRYHVTASTRGFHINQSTQDEFKPKAAPQHFLSHSLIDLLNHISPAFKRNFQTLLKKRAAKHPFERVPTPYQIFSWMAPATEHCVDAIRAEDAISQRLGYEEHIPGQTRDWNEELQTTRELPRKTLPDRLIRERAIFKVHSDFVVAATRGAMAVIDGNIMAINPGEDAKQQMFLWNNIFFSLGFDVKDHYKDFGGDAAAYVAPGNDLQGVKAYASADPEGLFTLGTVVVDYRGYRVTAQSIIPGILEREQEQSVVYGSIDFGKTVVTHEKYKELLEKTANSLKIRQHNVINEKEEEIELYSSVECKGIIGNDGRHYVLDLLRTFPPDANYFPVEGEELSEAMKAMNYPKQHRHKLVCLRQELVDAFVESRYMAFVKHAALQFQQLRAKRLAEAEKAEKDKEDSEKTSSAVKALTEGEIKTDEAKELVKEFTSSTSQSSSEESSKEIVKKAALSVGSLSDTEFNITFNTDVFQPHVKHVNPESDAYKREKELVKEAAEFLVTQQIPTFIHDCLEHQSSPIDGYTLTEALHHSGINMRYLGKVTEIIKKYPQLHYLHSICVAELICRSVKHLFKTYMQGVEMVSLTAAISHFINCFLGSYPSPHANVNTETSHRSKKKQKQKNKNKALASSSADNHEWALETPKSLWKKIIQEAQDYYYFKFNCDSIDMVVEKYALQKVSLLRSFCKTLGVQILLREYSLDSKTKAPFGEDDIINFFPVVKHIHPKATDAYQVFTAGQQKIQQGLLREGYELISEALNLLNNVYGAMHPEIAACCRLLARLNYIMGDYGEAMSYEQRAVLMSERVLGIDHPNTITEYAHLALYCFANNQVSNALKLMYRARYLALLCHGENHPEVALFDSNIGLILHAVGEYDLSLRFLQKALDLNTKFYGAKSLKVAMSYHLVARAYSCKGDFRTALQHEKEAFGIYKQLLGEEHERTKESSECLKHLTQQAVKYQKTLNEIYKGEQGVAIPPLQINPPSLPAVLDTLNLINGIVFLHISPEDIERFREEMMRGQQASGSTGAAVKTSEKKLISPPLSPTETSAPSFAQITDGKTAASDNNNPPPVAQPAAS